MSSNNFKIMVVDDSVMIRKYVSKIIDSLDGMEIIATAPNGKIGLQKLYLYKPDLVMLDVEMPELDGIEFLKYIRDDKRIDKRPHVIMFSSLVGENSSVTFECLALGAADFIQKPEGKIKDNIEHVAREMEIKINELIKNAVPEEAVKKPEVEILTAKEKAAAEEQKVAYGLRELRSLDKARKLQPKIVAVGSSTGGPNSIRTLMKELGPLKVPMVIAQHMPAGFTTEFAKNLASMYDREVVEPEHGELLRDGVIYVCPGGFHSKIKRDGSAYTYIKEDREYDGFFFKPSVDIFLSSVYESYGKDVLTVILSGMGRDGSIETVNLRKAGAVVLAQDKNSSVVWGMPGNSVKNGGVDVIVDIGNMGKAINMFMENRR